jgi:hypothetical protein
MRSHIQIREDLGMDQTKLAACGLSPVNRGTDCHLPIRAVSEPDSLATLDFEEPTNAIEAVRFLLLAEDLRRLGQSRAAERWQAKAQAWLAHLSAPSDG